MKVMADVKLDEGIEELYLENGGKGLFVPETPHSAGYDLRARKGGSLQPGETQIVGTGIRIAISDPNYCMQVLSRSGLSTKKIIVANSPGVVDSDYRGEVGIILINLSDSVFAWNKGARLAQALFVPVARPIITVVDELTETARGEGGFGSTGT